MARKQVITNRRTSFTSLGEQLFNCPKRISAVIFCTANSAISNPLKPEQMTYKHLQNINLNTISTCIYGNFIVLLTFLYQFADNDDFDHRFYGLFVLFHLLCNINLSQIQRQLLDIRANHR